MRILLIIGQNEDVNSAYNHGMDVNSSYTYYVISL